MSVKQRPLAAGKSFHCSVYFNYFEGPQSGRNGDHKLSKDFLQELEKRLRSIGCDEVIHFDNFIPGSNICTQSFSEMIIKAEKIVVIITEGLIENHWHTYVEQSAFKTLTDKNEGNQFLGIAVGLSKDELPLELGLCNEHLLYFEKNFKCDFNNWEKVMRFFKEGGLKTSNCSVPVQETGGDIETDGLNEYVNEEKRASNVEDSRKMALYNVLIGLLRGIRWLNRNISL